MRNRYRVLAAVVLGAILAACGAGDDPGSLNASVQSSHDPSPSVVIDDRPLEVQLREAINKADLPTVQALIDAGVDVNVDFGAGQTPLMSAAMAGNVDVVDALILAGAQIDAANSSGKTSLHLAVQLDYASVVTTLLKSGADWRIETGPPRFVAPIHYATEFDSAAAMAALLEFGVDVEMANSEFQATALFFTAFWDATECARLLVEYGANYNLATPEGITVLGAARLNQSSGVVAFLESIGASE